MPIRDAQNQRLFKVSDILVALDAAVEDGIDVLPISLSSRKPNSFFDESIAIGTFVAM